eukprot:2089838-Rhodomonas_salina.1
MARILLFDCTLRANSRHRTSAISKTGSGSLLDSTPTILLCAAKAALSPGVTASSSACTPPPGRRAGQGRDNHQRSEGQTKGVNVTAVELEVTALALALPLACPGPPS